MHKFLIFILNTCFIVSLYGQDSWMMHLKSIHQAYINPAYQPDKKFEVSGASYALDLNTGDLKAKDYITSTNGKKTISLKNLSSAVQNGTQAIGLYGSFNTFDLAYKINTTTFSFGQAINYYFNTTINGDLLNILANGNEAYIGKTAEIGMPVSPQCLPSLVFGACSQIRQTILWSQIKVSQWLV